MFNRVAQGVCSCKDGVTIMFHSTRGSSPLIVGRRLGLLRSRVQCW
jgi:hypothetical protein